MTVMTFVAYAAEEGARTSSGIASFIPLLIIFVIFYFINKKSKKNYELPANLNSKSGNITSGWKLDKILILIGVIGLLSSLFMDTSVETSMGTHVNNIGLMKDQQNYIIISGIILFIGVILNISNRKKYNKSETEPFIKVNIEPDSKKCAYCAETIKREAIICRFCGKDQG